jgi:hypothetical protein
MQTVRSSRCLVLVALAATAIETGCSGTSGTPVAPIRSGAAPSATPIATASPAPSIQPSTVPPTATPRPSATPIPSATPAPTATPTPSTACGGSLPAGAKFYATSFNNLGDNSVLAGAADFSGTPTNAFAGGTALNQPIAAALDASGRVYVANFAATLGGVPSIQVYPADIGCAGPLSTLTGSNTQLQGPDGVAVDSAGFVYVSNTPTSVALYAPLSAGTQNTAPVSVATLAVTASNGISNNVLTVALDANGRVFVASAEDNEVLVLPARAGTTLSNTPVATITGAATLLDDPRGVAFDAAGHVYVANQTGPSGPGSITEYAANPAGTTNAAPIAQLTGSATKLENPLGVAIDRNGEIYVSDAESGILEFAASPSGVLNEAPAGSFAGGPVPGGGDFFNAFGVAAH